VHIEPRAAEPERIAAALGREIHAALGLRARVAPAAFGSLPRFDLKAKRFTDHRKAAK